MKHSPFSSSSSSSSSAAAGTAASGPTNPTSNGANAITARMVSSCVGAMIANVTVHPLEVVKVRLQNESILVQGEDVVQHSSPYRRRAHCSHPDPAAAAAQQPPKPPTTATTTPTTSSASGSYSQYPNLPSTSKISPTSSSSLSGVSTTYSYYSHQQQYYHHYYHHPRCFSGPAAKAAVATLPSTSSRVVGGTTAPATTTTTTTTASHGEFRQTIAMIRQIAQQEGAGGFYKGLSPSLAMIVPNAMVYYTIYDCWAAHFRQQQQQHQNSQSSISSWIIPLVGGSGARLIASTVTAPLDYLRTVQAAQVVTTAATGAAATTRTMTTSGGGMVHHFHTHNGSSDAWWEPLRQLWKTQGIRSWYRGLEPLLWRDVPFAAIYWLCVEKLRDYSNQHQSTDDGSGPDVPLVVQDLVYGTVSATLAALVTTPADVVKTRYQAALFTTTHKDVTPKSILRDLLQPPQHQPGGGHGRGGGLGVLWKGNLARTLKVAPYCAIMLATYECGKRTFLEAAAAAKQSS
ncbi:hypothetical protein ACA910_006553 [Epithemia clementina (nom. ined.)]